MTLWIYGFTNTHTHSFGGIEDAEGVKWRDIASYVQVQDRILVRTHAPLSVSTLRCTFVCLFDACVQVLLHLLDYSTSTYCTMSPHHTLQAARIWPCWGRSYSMDPCKRTTTRASDKSSPIQFASSLLVGEYRSVLSRVCTLRCN